MATSLFPTDILQPGLQQTQLLLVRTRSVDVFSMIAVPAHQAQVVRKSKANNYYIPATASNTVVFGLAWVMASGIFSTIPTNVVDCQELSAGLTTARAFIPVMLENCDFIPSRFISSPAQYSGFVLLVRFQQVRSSFDYAIPAKPLAVSLVGTLQAKTLRSSFNAPSAPLFSLCHLMCNVNITESLMRIETELMTA
jgi:hypothetical protein